MSDRDDATQWLSLQASGDLRAADQLMELVYDQLKALAATYLRGERMNHTLSPTAVVHEAYVRLIDQSRIDWQGEQHFKALAAKTLRRVLVDHARTRDAKKRGGPERNQMELHDTMEITEGRPLDLLALNECLERLAKLSARQAEVVELRFFGDLTIKETAAVLDIHEDTVKWSWRMARAWLLEELGDKDGS